MHILPPKLVATRETLLRVGGLDNRVVSIELRSGLRYRTGEPLPIFETAAYVYTYAARQHVARIANPAEWLRHFPAFGLLASLNMADTLGIKQGATGNCYYWLAGIFDGLDLIEHGGNGSRAKSSRECLEELTEATRLERQDAAALAMRVLMAEEPSRQFWTVETPKLLRLWATEAREAIATYGLTEFGDVRPVRRKLELVKA